MNNYISEKKLYLFLAIVAIESLAANFAHPITPTLIKNLQLPDYMFGVAFAGMAFTNFLFSPFWAKMVNRISSRKTLLICCCGYGVGQIMFMLAQEQGTILMARFTSGFFVGGIMVSFLTYVINKGNPEIRGKHLALNATCTTVFGAFGYLIGGFIGVISIPFTFMLQAGTLILSGVMFYFLLEDDKQPQKDTFKFVRDANPFKAFSDSRQFMNKLFVILFLIVFITSLASTAYDQCFNYYIKDAFDFNSSYNGTLKAVVGFISLLANTTICLWILRNTDVRKSLMYIFLGASTCLFMIFLFDDILPFILVNIIFFAFNAMYIPLVQDLCAKNSNNENSSMVMGFYNAMKSLGMIVGALFAGFIYALGAKLSFLFAGIFFGCALVLMAMYRRKQNEKELTQKN
ncbi:DHA1 family multidrug resistance protein-like MFS transporter [Breznakia sp. PF5-3]|uniref:MFS transporter n=1 Tax=unclassified Breznakia TaxID=2623764 RepID=UPI002406517F|nr:MULTISPECIES: MFS transporter [unclassified Breznakia]MDF9824803.1 DHA1 family multidrug resistance protein-like MFS transporter [Breznakia sp. PM6-1]MDF9835741.1 DHA1 family multidrug resistance protein-like MFS transporter [Breznakia sp. PF5-3]MDF9837827.1 DHA1 family multidrug resistance protein-like MFS transporter [Breznakia sp. PFB2-8]MDF9859802.1 DHA1 family multidrug resistance protein-like MFS transporter [Breznakia sp. PH5-24]